MSTHSSIFLKAIDIIENEGWQQGEYNNKNEAGETIGPYCVLGACAKAMNVTPGTFEYKNEYTILGKVVPEDTGYFVHRYNDRFITTKEDIISLLRKAHEYEWLEQAKQTGQSSAQPA